IRLAPPAGNPSRALRGPWIRRRPHPETARSASIFGNQSAVPRAYRVGLRRLTPRIRVNPYRRALLVSAHRCCFEHTALPESRAHFPPELTGHRLWNTEDIRIAGPPDRRRTRHTRVDFCRGSAGVVGLDLCPLRRNDALDENRIGVRNILVD